MFGGGLGGFLGAVIGTLVELPDLAGYLMAGLGGGLGAILGQRLFSLDPCP